jgi:hypothetical protein
MTHSMENEEIFMEKEENIFLAHLIVGNNSVVTTTTT